MHPTICIHKDVHTVFADKKPQNHDLPRSIIQKKGTETPTGEQSHSSSPKASRMPTTAWLIEKIETSLWNLFGFTEADFHCAQNDLSSHCYAREQYVLPFSNIWSALGVGTWLIDDTVLLSYFSHNKHDICYHQAESCLEKNSEKYRVINLACQTVSSGHEHAVGIRDYSQLTGTLHDATITGQHQKQDWRNRNSSMISICHRKSLLDLTSQSEMLERIAKTGIEGPNTYPLHSQLTL